MNAVYPPTYLLPLLTSVVEQLEVLEHDDVPANLVQESSVVAHHQHCVRVALQVALEKAGRQVGRQVGRTQRQAGRQQTGGPVEIDRTETCRQSGGGSTTVRRKV